MKRERSRTLYSMRNIGTSLFGQLLSTILKFIVRTVFIQTLGKQYLGINGLFSDILTMLSLTELGLDTAINFRLYKPLAEKDTKRIRILMKFYKKAYRIIGCTIFIIGLGLIPLLPHLIKDYDSLDVLGINAGLIFMLHILRTASSYLFFAYRSAIIKADQKKYILDVVGFVITILTNIAKILVLIILKDFVIYTATVIVFNIVQNCANAIIVNKTYPFAFEHEEENMSREEVKSLLKDCGALFVYKINGVIAKGTDSTIISAFIGLATVGLYSNYLLFYTTAQSFLDKLYYSVKASMGNLFATSTIEKKYKFFLVMNFLSVLLFGTVGIGIATCADEVITIWIGKDFVLAQPFAILIGIELLIHGITMNLGQIREVSGAFRQMWFRPIVSAVINLVVSLILVQICGIYGVIIGTIVSALFTNVLIDPYILHKVSFERYRPVSDYYKRNGKYLLLLCEIFIAELGLCRYVFIGHGWLSVISHMLFVGITVPFAIVVVYWRSMECKYIVQLGKKVIRRFINR